MKQATKLMNRGPLSAMPPPTLAQAEMVHTKKGFVPLIVGAVEVDAAKAPMNIDWLLPRQLYLDQKVLVNPRDPNRHKAKCAKINAEFDWNKFNPPKVSPRDMKTEDGLPMFAVIDGGHGVSVIMNSDTKPTRLGDLTRLVIPCHVVDRTVSCSRVKEADVFCSQTNRTRLTAADYFIVGVVAKKAEPLAVLKLMHEIGMDLPGDKRSRSWPNKFTSIPTLQAIYRCGDDDSVADEERGTVLRDVMLDARAIWPDRQPPPLSVTALAITRKAYPNLDDERLRHAVTGLGDPQKYIQQLKDEGSTHHYQKAAALAHRYVDAYDREYRGTLLGGERKGKHNRYEASPDKRAPLNSAADVLVHTWKMTNKAE